MSKKPTFLLIYGGVSTEHEVSLKSASFFVRSLNKDKYQLAIVGIDKDGNWRPQKNSEILTAGHSLPLSKEHGVVYIHKDSILEACSKINDCEYEGEVIAAPIMHGTQGEDGQIQAACELMDIAYIGADVEGSAIGMDKQVSKVLCEASGVPVVPYLKFTKYDWLADSNAVITAIKEKFSCDVFIKPCYLGSSVGVYKVKDHADLEHYLEKSFSVDHKIIVEQSINAREIEFAVKGNASPQVTVPGEVKLHGVEFYDYDAKYNNPDAYSVEVPAKLSEKQIQQGQELALKAFKALSLQGLARVDFMLCRDTGKFYFNEVNTLPGFTSVSLYPVMWKHMGIDSQTLIDQLIHLGFERYQERKALKRSYD